MAEARSAVVAPHVALHAEGTSKKEAEVQFLKSFQRSAELCIRRTKNQIANGLWPTTWSNLVMALGVIAGMMHFNYPAFLTTKLWAVSLLIHLDGSYPYNFRIAVVSIIVGIVYFVILWYVRQYLMRMMLAYRGWMYENPRSQSILTLMWGLILKTISGRHPRLYSNQNSLPKMPVPSLKATLQGFLDSVQPLLEEKEYDKFVQQAKDFEKNVGPKLQVILQLKSWWSTNYCSDWWEKYVYLMSRSPLPINSNYYCMDQHWSPTKIQTARAATITYFLLHFRHDMETEELAPLLIRNTIPVCMWQYERTFKTTRIPGEEIDELVHFEHTVHEHIVVLCNGNFYTVPVTNDQGVYLSLLDLQSQMDWIKHDAQHSTVTSTHPEGCIPALTTLPRSEWAKIRKEEFSDGLNKESLAAIEESLFVVILEDKSFKTMSERGKYLLHGNGHCIWFDKTFNVVVFEDGKVGINAEHSFADAPVIGHMVEYTFTEEFIYRTYDDEGHCKPVCKVSSDSKSEPLRSKYLHRPSRLQWDLTPKLTKQIEDSVVLAQKNNDDLHLCVHVFDSFGKGIIKLCKVSPDAFIQMVLQLAYYKDSGGKFALTYEASMTRLYLQGRTETVRSLTKESKAFVKAMVDETVDVEEKKNRLYAAAKVHAKMYKDCMNGKGIDRHLFALFVVCRGQGLESDFLKDALSLPWTLSTSQQPQQQMNVGLDINDPAFSKMLSPGGGFGPVNDDGYGVSYMVPNDTQIFFHVSSKHFSPLTDSERFSRIIFETMTEVKNILYPHDKED